MSKQSPLKSSLIIAKSLKFRPSILRLRATFSQNNQTVCNNPNGTKNTVARTRQSFALWVLVIPQFYTIKYRQKNLSVFYSERRGFEPLVELLPHNLSKIAP